MVAELINSRKTSKSRMTVESSPTDFRSFVFDTSTNCSKISSFTAMSARTDARATIRLRAPFKIVSKRMAMPTPIASP